MGKQEEIKECINDIRVHYDSNLNNKYVKNIILKLDIPSETRHYMGIILDYKTLYFDSKGTIEDIYNGIKAICHFIKEVRIRVLPNIESYAGENFLSASGVKDPNERILYKMATKNYPMNIKMLAKHCLKLLKLCIEYDDTNFTKTPAYASIKGFSEIESYLMEIIKDTHKI